MNFQKLILTFKCLIFIHLYTIYIYFPQFTQHIPRKKNHRTVPKNRYFFHHNRYKCTDKRLTSVENIQKRSLIRVTRGKTPRFQHNIIFSQKLSEIFQLCKVHVFTKLLGHILTFKNIIFHI